MEIIEPKQIQIKDYSYELPDSRIAKFPLARRDSSKLLVCRNNNLHDSTFDHLYQFIPEDSLLIFNNTKVIQARLHFRKETGALIEIFCLEPFSPNDYLLNFQQTTSCEWLCMVGNLKKWKQGDLMRQVSMNGKIVTIRVSMINSEPDSHRIRFEWDCSDYCFSDLLDMIGELPIPPYLNRPTQEKDKETYQTVYSKIEGSVAAPTAGLHFTSAVFDSLKNKHVETQELTLHVGAGTFRPVKSDRIGDHGMHSEFISIKKELIRRLLSQIESSGNIIAVGTTSVRSLESLYYIGCILSEDVDFSSIHVSQWIPYEKKYSCSSAQALQNILLYLDKHNLSVLNADTQIIIAPGYEFKIVNGIITNFHQPQSTLLLLVSAFLGQMISWKKIYDHALANDYRFLSYGDSSLLLKSKNKE